ncbi:SUF system Fe-S cluster assembly regulator [Herminiimonas sp. CN]|uniref:SUF system Fe-S cluster assembly regulator n=1 Tax=Herminiimonas sp. CN TaxID=1349818 RepID=UPI000473B4E5|nr:SUF system Fe-S cluster assembly regulator [Herminiimonas sp. CN]
MLRMSKMADYGTVILTTMVHQPERIQSAAGIAAVIRVPVPTVSKILKILTREGLVTSLRGAKGGYLLSRPPTEITISHIINAMDGPIGMTECSITPGLCSQESGCPVRANWQRVNRVVLDALDQVTLDQMIQPVAETVNISALRRPLPQTAPAMNRGINGEQP